jgi:hypothetical protein
VAGVRGWGLAAVVSAAVSRAGTYLARRHGRTAFAVIDSAGRLSGVRVHSRFYAASVVKAMLLVGFLRWLDTHGQHRMDPHSNSFLYPMIHVSDNDAATWCWSIVGDGGMYAVAAAAHMSDFSVHGLWGTALLSPADQARFFYEMDSLIPSEFDWYARWLLSTIARSQSWGIPAVAGARADALDRGDERRRSDDALRDRHDRGRHAGAASLSSRSASSVKTRL